MPRRSYVLLGRISVSVDGQPVDLKPMTAVFLARLLVARGRSVPVATLYRDVWNDPRRVRLGRENQTAVHKRVKDLRDLLGEPTPLVTGDEQPTAYLLSAADDEVDVWRFRRLVAEARDADAERAIACLTEALGLWGDEPLLGAVEIPFAAKALDSWAIWRGRARQDLVTAYRRGGRDDRADALLEELLAESPDDPDLAGLRMPRAAATAALPRVWNVPRRMTAFVPRSALVDEITAHVGAGPVVLHGLGGVGKTRLAAEYAHLHAGRYRAVWWLDADDAERLGEQLTALAVQLGACGPGTPVPVAFGLLLRHLRAELSGGWLLVYDNAEDPDAIADWLPDSAGHVLITSRSPDWTEVASGVEVAVLDRASSCELLLNRVRGLDAGAADTIAEQVGDLPLALAQAAGYMVTAGMPAAEYLAALAAGTARVATEGRPRTYPVSLARAVELSCERLADREPDAWLLLRRCAVLAPEVVPRILLSRLTGGDPVPAVAAIGRIGLATVDGTGLLIHRLVQAVIRDQLTGADRVSAVVAATAAVVALAPEPDDVGNRPRTRPLWSGLLPHVLALGPESSADAGLRSFAVRIGRFLLGLGEIKAGHRLAERLYTSWSRSLGPADRHTLLAGLRLAMARSMAGEEEESIMLNRDILARMREHLGPDDPDTLLAENVLVMHLLDDGEAKALAESNVANRARVLGPGHPDTLWSLVAFAWRFDDDPPRARDAARRAWDGLRVHFGDDHPSPNQAAGALAGSLLVLGEPEEAARVGEYALGHLRRILGEDHLETLEVQSVVARAWQALGRDDEALDLADATVGRLVAALGPDHPACRRLATDLAPLTGRR